MQITIITTIITIVMFLILIGWTWNSLGSVENIKKIIYIISGIVIVYILTFVIYNVSKIGIAYENMSVMLTIRKIYIIIFTFINCYLILPFIFKNIDRITSSELKKDDLSRIIIKLAIKIVIIFIFESIYLGNIQQGILKMINK